MQAQNRQPIDVIFLDLEMPILDGYAACQKIIQYYKILDNNLNPSKKKRKLLDLKQKNQKHIIETIKKLCDQVQKAVLNEEKTSHVGIQGL